MDTLPRTDKSADWRRAEKFALPLASRPSDLIDLDGISRQRQNPFVESLREQPRLPDEEQRSRRDVCGLCIRRNQRREVLLAGENR